MGPNIQNSEDQVKPTHRCYFAGLAVAFAAFGGCNSATGPDDGSTVEIALSVSGGIAGVDWQFTLSGADGQIIGNRCQGPVGCDWTDGELLATIDPADLMGLANEFIGRGFFDGPTDFGTECCDQFDYVLSYRDADDDRTVTGSEAKLPGNVRSLILLVEQFVSNARE